MPKTTPQAAQDKGLAEYIRTIPDFPAPGVQFRDVTTLFGDAEGFRRAVDGLTAPWLNGAGKADRVDAVVAMDARGFVLGGAAAYRMGLACIPIRKEGKLPGATLAESYSLEYGEATAEIHEDALAAGTRVLLVDDLLATGGTAAAAVRLIERLGGDIAAAGFVVNLPDLGGERRLREMGVDVYALCAFEGG